jgi:hypothetical protein
MPGPGTTYNGTCSTLGQQVEWRSFAYNSVLPPNTNVQFFGQTPSMSAPAQIAWAGKTEPAVCGNGLGGGMGACVCSNGMACPVDLTLALNGGTAPAGYGGNAFQPSITISAQLNPNPGGTQAPTVNAWQLRYSCIDAQ